MPRARMDQRSGRGWAIFAIAIAVAAVASLASAATGNIDTVAGTGSAGSSGDGGPATAAQLAGPVGVEPTDDGGYLIADQGNSRVRRVSPGGNISTFPGTAAAGLSPAINGLAELPDGGILIADSSNNRIVRVSPAGTAITVAGTGAPTFGGDGGPATAAQIRFPSDIAVRPDGSYLITDTDNHVVREVDPSGDISTVAGTPMTPGGAGDSGPASSAQLNKPSGIALSPDGGFLVTELFGHRVRRVSPGGVITRVAGTGAAGSVGDGGPSTDAELNQPAGIATMPDGGFVVNELNGDRTRRVSPGGTITTLAGTGVGGFSAMAARRRPPSSTCRSASLSTTAATS